MRVNQIIKKNVKSQDLRVGINHYIYYEKLIFGLRQRLKNGKVHCCLVMKLFGNFDFAAICLNEVIGNSKKLMF